MTSKEHTQYRTTKEWKEFRKKLIQDKGPRCECCGTKYAGKRVKQLQVHHRDPDNYMDLNPNKFAVLCSSCHDETERLAKKVTGSKSNDIPSLEKWLDLFLPFLPLKALEAVQAKYPACLTKEIAIQLNKLRILS